MISYLAYEIKKQSLLRRSGGNSTPEAVKAPVLQTGVATQHLPHSDFPACQRTKNLSRMSDLNGNSWSQTKYVINYTTPAIKIKKGSFLRSQCV